MSSTGKGRVARVIGPVVDIEFPADSMPSIFNALHVETTMSGTTRTLEASQQVLEHRFQQLQVATCAWPLRSESTLI